MLSRCYRFLCSFLFLTVVSFATISLSAQQIIPPKSIFPVASIDPTQTDFRDLQFLKQVLKDRQIVLLGEQSHGDGATFEAKVRLVKCLHQEMGFEIIAFENGLYDLHHAYQQLLTGKQTENPLKEALFPLWADTKAVDNLLTYITETVQSPRPLQAAGFDSQEGTIFQENFLPEVRQVLARNRIVLDDSIFNHIEQVVAGDVDYLATNRQDSTAFFRSAQVLYKALERLEDEGQVGFLRQVLTSWLADVNYTIDQMQKRDSQVQNPRDLQMAKNLIFLSNFYPNKKIIGWGASYHFAKQIDYQNTPLTRQCISEMAKTQKETGPFDLDKELAGAVPMGQTLRQYFSDRLYSLAFASAEGRFGVVGEDAYPLVAPPPGSIEKELADAGHNFAFVEYRNFGKQPFYSSALGNLPVLAPWPMLFDGLFFIKTAYPPAPLETQTVANQALLSDNLQKKTDIRAYATVAVQGRVLNQETKTGIAYATVALVGTSRGVVANSEGFFTIHVPAKGSDWRLSFSAIGFRSDTVFTQKLLKTQGKKTVPLSPKAYTLAEVQVTDKALTAKEIVKRARNRIRDNYYQQPYNQEMFYRVRQQTNDTVIFNEESFVWVYDDTGYQPAANAYKHLYGEILQIRNTTGNADQNKWEGVGSLW
ncbi:MAG: erythromycin esterase family protein, partial [Cytophagales bacterium]|nr:erythromycin esterase family protein [Cytophagales bacterium]